MPPSFAPAMRPPLLRSAGSTATRAQAGTGGSRDVAREDWVCRRLMTAPGVGTSSRSPPARLSTSPSGLLRRWRSAPASGSRPDVTSPRRPRSARPPRRLPPLTAHARITNRSMQPVHEPTPSWRRHAQCRRSPALFPPHQPAPRPDLGDRRHNLAFARVAERPRPRQDDDGPARPSDPPSRYRRDRQREMAFRRFK